MTLFANQINVNIPAITAEIAQEVYGYIKEHWSATVAFVKSNKYYLEYFLDIEKELDALETVAMEVMMSEDSPTSIKELENELSSELLSIEIFVTDFMDYVMIYEEGTTRDDFLAQFTLLKEQQDVEQI